MRWAVPGLRGVAVTRRSEVERVARELCRIIEDDPGGAVLEDYDAELQALYMKAAAWVLRRERGRTVGYVFLKRECDESGEDCWFEFKSGLLDGPVNVRMSQMIHDEVARVVLVPRRKRR